MSDLPKSIIRILTYFAPIFSVPVFKRICLLFKGHVVSKGRRTVCDILRCLGLENESSFSMFHRVFYGAVWSGLNASKILFQLILKFLPYPEIIIAIDTHVERRKGPNIKGLGIQRDAVNSTKNRKVLVPGINWLITTVVARLPWTNKKCALPFLSIPLTNKKPLITSKNKHDKKPRNHKKLTDWMCQVISLIRNWAGKLQKIIIVADSAFACCKVCLKCIANEIGFISRMRMDACLHDFVELSNSNKKGRPRVRGKRLKTPGEMALDPNLKWTSSKVEWYGGGQQEVFISTLDCIWYAGHKGNIPIRLVLIKTSLNGKVEAFFSTVLTHAAEYIIECYVSRWPIEVTFEEARRHLGVETQRQWCDKSIDRETPCLFASFTLINLIGLQMISESDPIKIKETSWYKKEEATFSDVYMHVKESILRQEFLSCRPKGRHERNMFEKLMSLLVAA